MFAPILAILGAILALLGFHYRNEVVLLPSLPTEMTAEEAVNLIKQQETSYVKINTNLSEVKRLYPTDLIKPTYVTCTPEESYKLIKPRDGTISPPSWFVGCVVEVDTEIQDSFVTYEYTEKNSRGKADHLVFKFHLAPVNGSDNKLWVVSKRLYGFQAGEGWLKKTTFKGRLTDFEDLPGNIRLPDDQFASLIGKISVDLGIRIPLGAQAILTEFEPDTGNLGKLGSYFVPFPNTKGAFLLMVNQEDKHEQLTENAVTGIMETVDGDRFQKLFTHLGVEAVDKVGLLTLKSAFDYNRSQKRRDTYLFEVGLWMFFVGAGLSFLKETGSSKSSKKGTKIKIIKHK